MNENFKIALNFKRSILYLDKTIVNFPANEKVLKDKIKETMYDILELIYLANEFSAENRITYQKKAIVKLKMIDFYMKTACEKKYISYKKYQKVSNNLLEVVKGLFGWIKYEKAQ